MLLILTNSTDATADYMCVQLSQAAVTFRRLDTDKVLERCRFRYADGVPSIDFDGDWLRPDALSQVWYRRPEKLRHPHLDQSTPEGRYALDEWADALEGFLSHVPSTKWMNHPSANARASQKLEQLTVATRHGLTVPRTLVTQDAAELRAFWRSNAGRVIAKPISNGHIDRGGEGADSLIYTNPLSEHDLDDLRDLLVAPTLFQERIDKQSDVRITVIDRRIHAVELLASGEDGHQRCDIRRSNMEDVRYNPIVLPRDVLEALASLLDEYGLRFAAVDMAVTRNGQWVFFEVNPNGQWAWMDLAGATSMAATFIEVFAKSAPVSSEATSWRQM